MEKLPAIKKLNTQNIKLGLKRLLIAAEGFEERSMSFPKALSKNEKYFQNCLICKYLPEKRTRLDELLAELKTLSETEPTVIEFHRFFPYLFESNLNETLSTIMNDFDEILIDISVMSKLLILIIINGLKKYEGTLRIIYTEPYDYAPSQTDYIKQRNVIDKPIVLPSYGVHDVVRTPFLSSVVMQQSSSLIITFTSFNEQLNRALLSSINPTRLLLINGVPPHLSWREKATQEIHKSIIKDFYDDNPINEQTGLLERSTSTLYYHETFELLTNIYKENCYNFRMIIAPIGSKMQGLACAIFKLCCPDVHIEYPTPESFYIRGYSSEKVRLIHEIEFKNIFTSLRKVSEIYELNG